MKQLQDYRKEIDKLDSQLIEVIAARFSVNQEIKQLKQRENLPNIDPQREKEMIEERRDYAVKLGVDPDFVESIFKSILSFTTKD